jgi:CRP-like cAMP-binding protein
MSTTATKYAVASAPLFAGLSKKQQEHLEQLSTVIEVKAGVELTREGQIGREFGVLLDGTATVSIDGKTVATLAAGDHFGEMSLLAEFGQGDVHRSATVVADGDQWIAVMSLVEFRTLLREFPEINITLQASADERAASNKAIH